MNILILEDRGSFLHSFNELMIAEGHTVFSAISIFNANEYLENEKIDCLIVDLNMATYGLKKEEVLRTHNGLLTGWIWLNKYAYKKNPHLRKSTIIFSGYIKELYNFVSKDDLKDIHLIEKNTGMSTILNLIKVFEKRIERIQ
jgi:hypothetical protein